MTVEQLYQILGQTMARDPSACHAPVVVYDVQNGLPDEARTHGDLRRWTTQDQANSTWFLDHPVGTMVFPIYTG